jgi:hypothetical protein
MKSINVSKFARHFATLQRQLANPHIDKIHAEHSQECIDELLELLPHGSGIDAGVRFDADRSTGEKLIFTFGFHHMDENGYYDGWSEHELIITPSLQEGYKLRITGRDRNLVKEYLYSLFYEVFYYDASEPLHKPQPQG